MGKILLKNIVTEGVVSDILIEGNRISGIFPADASGCQAYQGAEVVDCGGKTAVPGFVNMHTHAGMSMMRGIGEDIAFHEWLDRIWQVESKIDEEWVYHATKVACLEMIKTGTTTFNDHYWYMAMGRKAAVEMGAGSIAFSTLPSNWKSPYMYLDREAVLTLVNTHLNPYVEERTMEDLNIP
jgi:5-methylthioadenosine/S-adenosylhomocysteine deaminase